MTTSYLSFIRGLMEKSHSNNNKSHDIPVVSVENEKYLVVTTDDIHFCAAAALIHSFNYDTFVFCIPAATIMDETRTRQLDGRICQLPYRPTTILFLGNFRDYISRKHICQESESKNDPFEKHFGSDGVAMVMYCDSEACKECFMNVTVDSDRRDMRRWRKLTAKYYRNNPGKRQKRFQKYLALRAKRILREPMSEIEESKWSYWRQPALDKLNRIHVFSKNAPSQDQVVAGANPDPFAYRKRFLDAMRDRVTNIMHPELEPEEKSMVASFSPPAPYTPASRIADIDDGAPEVSPWKNSNGTLSIDQYYRSAPTRYLVVHREQMPLMRFLFETIPLSQRLNPAYTGFRSIHERLLDNLNFWGYYYREYNKQEHCVETNSEQHVDVSLPPPHTVSVTKKLSDMFQKIDWAAEAAERGALESEYLHNNKEFKEIKRNIISVLCGNEEHGGDGEFLENVNDKRYRIYAFLRLFMGRFGYKEFLECGEKEFQERSRTPFEKKMDEHIDHLAHIVKEPTRGEHIASIHQMLYKLQACKAKESTQTEYRHYMENNQRAQFLHSLFPAWTLAHDAQKRFERWLSFNPKNRTFVSFLESNRNKIY